VGRKTRTVSTPLRRALYARDRGFGIVRDEGGALRFVTADGRSIPRRGYRLEDFVDDDAGNAAENADQNPSREGFCTTLVQDAWERFGVRETAAVYRLWRGSHRARDVGSVAARR